MKEMYTFKKRIAVDAYFSNNFGDDLFLEILINRYPNALFDFITPSDENIKNFTNNNRVRRTSRKQVLKNVKSYDIYVMIGGSMFQQPQSWKMQWINLFLTLQTFKTFKKKCVILGCNFGPFSTNLYLKAYKYLFKKLDYISVRDTQSYRILNDKNINIHCYPDIVFSYEINTTRKSSENDDMIIGVSIMDFGKNNPYYEKKMEEILTEIQKYAKVKVFSFQSSNEISDYKVIKRVLSKIPNKNIEVILYEGNISPFLRHYTECNSFLTTRFHSLILSLLCNQNIVAINYNSKIKNTLKFLNIDIEMVELDELDSINISSLLNARKYSHNLSEIKSQAVEHFEFLDSVIEVKK